MAQKQQLLKFEKVTLFFVLAQKGETCQNFLYIFGFKAKSRALSSSKGTCQFVPCSRTRRENNRDFFSVAQILDILLTKNRYLKQKFEAKQCEKKQIKHLKSDTFEKNKI